MQVEVVAFNHATSTGNQTITASGLGGATPKAVFFCFCGSDVFDDDDAHSQMGWGAVDGTRQWAISGVSEDGQGTSNAGSIHKTDKCIVVLDDDRGGINGEAEFVSFGANQVTINWTNAPVDDFKNIAIFFAGDDLSVRADTYLLGSQDNEVDITAPGFRPKLIWGATRGGGSGGGIEDDQRLSIGAAVDNGSGYDQRCWFFSDRDAESTMDVHSWIYNNRFGGRDAFYTVELANPDASGFSSYTRSDSPSGDYMSYLALDFDNPATVFGYDIPNSTGNQSKTGIGFQPICVAMGYTSADAENTDMNGGTEANVHGFGAFTTTDEYTNGIKNQDGESDSDTSSEPFDTFLTGKSVTSSTLVPDSSYVSMDSDGFTLNYTVAGYSPVRKAWGVAIGPEPPPSTTAFMMVS